MIDKNKKYKTRSGLPVRIYAIDDVCDYPVRGAYFYAAKWLNFYWTKNGLVFINQLVDCELDLIEIDCEEGEGL